MPSGDLLRILERLQVTTPGGEPTEGTEESAVGRYPVRRELARGGMGVILEVRDRELRRNLAMKVVLDPGRVRLAGLSEVEENRLARFLEEAQITGQLDHPGIVPVHELGLDADGRLYFTMRLVRGRTLEEVFALTREGRDGWTRTRALGVVLKVCEAMAFAHEKGVVHRDLKPSNVMVGRFGETYVMDWGLGKLLGQEDRRDIRLRKGPATTISGLTSARRDDSRREPDSPLLTMDGDVVGTPAYMAPEQAMGRLDEVGPRSDVYSVGAMLYHLLTGHGPYLAADAAVSPHVVLQWVIDGAPRPLHASAPDELAAICERAMARAPEKRYESMLDMAEDLRAFLEGRVVRAYQTGALAEARKWIARNRALAASLAAAVLLAVGGLGWNGWTQARAREAIAGYADDLEETNRALEVASASAIEARDRAREQEAEARWQSYAASIAAANASLDVGAASEARRRLEACDESLRGWEWEHLRLRADSSLRVLSGHGSFVWSVAFGPDGRLVASGSGSEIEVGGVDRSARVWDGETGKELQRLPHARDVTSVAFSPSGTELATATPAERVSLWHVESGRLLEERANLGQWVAFLPDGSGLVAANEGNGLISRWDLVKSENDVTELGRDPVFDNVVWGEQGSIRSLAVSRDGRLVATGGWDGRVRVRRLADGELVLDQAAVFGERTLGTLWEGVLALDFSPDGASLGAATADGEVHVFDLTSGERSALLSGHRGPVSAVRFSLDGRQVVSAGLDGTIRFWDPVVGEPLEVLHGHDGGVRALALSPVGDRLVTGSQDTTVRVWDGQPGSAETTLLGGGATDQSLRVAFSPDGERVAWLPEATAVRVSDARTGEDLVELPRDRFALRGSVGAVVGLAFDPSGSRLITVTDRGRLRTWGSRTGAIVGPIVDLGSGIATDHAELDPSRTRVALWRDDGTGTTQTLELWSTEGELLHVLAPGAYHPWALEFSPDGTLLVGGTEDEILLFDTRTGAELRRIPARDVPTVAFDPSGRTLYTHGWEPVEKTVRVWDVETGALLRTLTGHAPPSWIETAPDGQRLLTGNWDGTVSLWDTERGEIVSLDARAGPVHAAAFSPDGVRIACGGQNGRHKIWDTTPPTERESVRRAAALRSRLEPRARELVDALFEELVLTDDVVAALEGDPTLEAGLRDAAVRLARLRPPGINEVIARVRPIVLAPGRPAAEYLFALRLSEAAARIWSESDFRIALNLGAGHYRLGRLERARTHLEQADADFRQTFGFSLPIIRAFLAMIDADQGRLDDARQELALARSMMPSFDLRAMEMVTSGVDELLVEAARRIEALDPAGR